MYVVKTRLASQLIIIDSEVPEISERDYLVLLLVLENSSQRVN